MRNEEACARLAKTVFRAEGPGAPCAIFAWWAGINVTDAMKGVEEDVGEEGIEIDVLLVGRLQHQFGDRRQRGLEFGLLHVLQHSRRLEPRWLMMRSSFRQVVGGRLHAHVCRRRRRTPWLTTTHRRQRADFRIAVIAHPAAGCPSSSCMCLAKKSSFLLRFPSGPRMVDVGFKRGPL